MTRWLYRAANPRFLARLIYSGAIVGRRVDRTENLGLLRLSFTDVACDFGLPRQSIWTMGGALPAWC